MNDKVLKIIENKVYTTKKMSWKFTYVAVGEDQAVTHVGSFRLKSVMERLKVNWELSPFDL